MRALLALLVLSGGPGALAAQEAPSGLPQGFSLGATFDQYFVDGDRPAALSIRGIELRPDHVTSEFGLGVLFSRNQGQSTLLLTDLGGAYQIPMAGMHLLLHGGPTLAISLEGESHSAAIGGFAGAGLIARLTGRLAIRGDISRRWFLQDVIVSGSMIAVGFTVLPAGPAPIP